MVVYVCWCGCVSVCGRCVDTVIVWGVGVWGIPVGVFCVQVQNEWSSFSSNSDCGVEMNLHCSFYFFLHTLTGNPLLPGPRPRPHPDHLCGAILHLRGNTGVEDQV